MPNHAQSNDERLPAARPARRAELSIGLLAVLIVAIVAITVARRWPVESASGGDPGTSLPPAATAAGTSTPAVTDVVPSTPGTAAFPYAGACATQAFAPRQCDAIIDDAMDEARVGAGDVASVEFLPFERVQSLGGGQVARVRLALVVGTSVDVDVMCVGVSFRPACNEVAEIMVSAGISHDVPCTGEPPAGCATVPPTPDPDAVRAATPFRLEAIDIPLGHRGAYEVRLGSATLPNGYLSERTLRLADPRPTSYWINTGVFLDVRSDVEGRPFVGSIYRDPFDGLEPVTIYLVFEVNHLEGPSVLQVRDVIVR